MKSVLIISPKEDEARLIGESLPEDYQVQNADSVTNALDLNRQCSYDVIFSDLNLLKDTTETDTVADAIKLFKKMNPLAEILVLSSKAFIRDTVKAVRAGAKDYLTYPIDPAEVRLAVESAGKSATKNLELDYLRDQFWKTDWIDIIRTRNSKMQDTFNKIRAVATTKATALLTGETGTGKGLMARIIHRHSNRSDDAFISVHCGAIPDTLLESELFGHEKGAFTGAVRKKPGKFELARSGTIFLDEIGTVSPSAQVKLLQVLQDGTFSRVGGEEVLTTDARIISATNSNLAAMSEKGEFRKDLFYRLNIFPVEIPPLRERVEDIDFLSELFLGNLNRKYGKSIHSIHAQVIRAFKNYHWPGNIRELENLMERAYILETSAILAPENFPAELFDSTTEEVSAIMPVDAKLPLSEARRQAIDDFERQYLKELFTRNRGKVSQTAEHAGVSTRQLNKLMVKYGIRKEAFKV
ncbi:Two-component system response regulator protein [Olavius algarvensis Delta 1 endosymbiont]|nr:Two-component system response regulator protein [Olavius algarvensis Delta 1 endosymbiont]